MNTTNTYVTAEVEDDLTLVLLTTANNSVITNMCFNCSSVVVTVVHMCSVGVLILC